MSKKVSKQEVEKVSKVLATQDGEKFSLSVRDRILLLGLLPREGNFLTLRILSDFRQGLGFTEKELSDFNIRQVGEQLTWDKGVNREFLIGKRTKDIIIESLTTLDKQEKLREEHIPLYLIFIGDEDGTSDT